MFSWLQHHFYYRNLPVTAPVHAHLPSGPALVLRCLTAGPKPHQAEVLLVLATSQPHQASR